MFKVDRVNGNGTVDLIDISEHVLYRNVYCPLQVSKGDLVRANSSVTSVIG